MRVRLRLISSGAPSQETNNGEVFRAAEAGAAKRGERR